MSPINLFANFLFENACSRLPVIDPGSVIRGGCHGEGFGRVNLRIAIPGSRPFLNPEIPELSCPNPKILGLKNCSITSQSVVYYRLVGLIEQFFQSVFIWYRIGSRPGPGGRSRYFYIVGLLVIYLCFVDDAYLFCVQGSATSRLTRCVFCVHSTDEKCRTELLLEFVK